MHDEINSNTEKKKKKRTVYGRPRTKHGLILVLDCGFLTIGFRIVGRFLLGQELFRSSFIFFPHTQIRSVMPNI